MPRILIAVALFYICSSTLLSQSTSGEVQFIGSSTKELITVSVNGYGKKKSVAYQDAIVKAFQVLLKSGIPGSTYYRPLLGNNALELYENNSSYFNSFFEQQTPRSFLIDQRSGNYNRRAKKTEPNLRVIMTINVVALRNHLENAGIIRKFGL